MCRASRMYTYYKKYNPLCTRCQATRPFFWLGSVGGKREQGSGNPLIQQAFCRIRGIVRHAVSPAVRRGTQSADALPRGRSAAGKTLDSPRPACYLDSQICRRGGMVDTRDLKSLAGNRVPVRVRSPAPSKKPDLSTRQIRFLCMMFALSGKCCCLRQ